MAKVKPSDETPSASVVDGLLFKLLPSGITSMQLPNQNRTNPTNFGMNGSPNFQTLDQSIVHWDASFDRLPDV